MEAKSIYSIIKKKNENKYKDLILSKLLATKVAWVFNSDPNNNAFNVTEFYLRICSGSGIY